MEKPGTTRDFGGFPRKLFEVQYADSGKLQQTGFKIPEHIITSACNNSDL